MDQDERSLWSVGNVECVMISCCTGAELQVRRGDEILLRELYPLKSDLYDRARELRPQYEGITTGRTGQRPVAPI
jgi:hypothetical protein